MTQDEQKGDKVERRYIEPRGNRKPEVRRRASMAEALGGGGSTVQQPAPSAVHGVSAFYAPDPKRASGKLLTSNDLMVMFDVTLMTIYNWRQRKGLPYTKLAGGKKPPVRYDEGLIRHWASIHGVPIKRELQEE